MSLTDLALVGGGIYVATKLMKKGSNIPEPGLVPLPPIDGNGEPIIVGPDVPTPDTEPDTHGH